MPVEGKIQRILDPFMMLQVDSDTRSRVWNTSLLPFNTLRHNDRSPKMEKELRTRKWSITLTIRTDCRVDRYDMPFGHKSIR